MDLDRRHTVRETSHRILNPFTSEKLATLGAALFLPPGARVLDLASGKGELLCTWARDHGISGVGVDISTAFVAAARARAEELGVGDRVRFEHADASSYSAADPVDVACCIGATWIGGGVPGTLDLLESSLRPGGLVLVGEPFWRRDPSGGGASGRRRGVPPAPRPRRAVRGPRLGRRRDGAGRRGQLGPLRGGAVAERARVARREPRRRARGRVPRRARRRSLRYVTWRRPYLGWGVLALRRRTRRRRP